MLEGTRKRGASILIYLVFGMLIVIFVINFGAQSAGSREGCQGPKSDTMLTIDGQDYSMNTWRWALNSRNGGSSPQRTQQALDLLVRREILAQEAERRGLAVSEGAIDANVREGKLWILGQPEDGVHVYFADDTTIDQKRPERCPEGKTIEDCTFYYDFLSGWVSNMFGLSVGTYKQEQRRELMAVAMEKVLESGAHASRDEAHAAWLHASLTTTADVVAFKPEDYAKKMILTDADVDRFVKDHEADVKAKYDADKGSYTSTVAEVHVRRVFVKKQAAPAPADGAGAGSGSGSASGSASGSGSGSAAPAADDPGKKKLEAARADIVAKKKTFVQVASELDDDDVIRGEGGDLGWKTADSPGLETKDLDDALKTLKPGGDPSPVIETGGGFWLLWVEDQRSGDLSYDQVKHEIAMSLAQDVWSKEAAKRDAIAALAKAQASGKHLSDLYVHAPEQNDETAPPGGLPPAVQKLFQEYTDPKTSPERKKEIEQIIQQLQQSGALGMAPWQSPDVPAAWMAAGDDTTTAPAGGTGTTTTDNSMTPSNDKLPEFAKMDPPMVQHLEGLTREPDEVPGIGKSEALVKALFDTIPEGKLADQVYEVKSTQPTENGVSTSGSEFVITEVASRTHPNEADFAKDADDLIDGMVQARGEQIVHDWLTTRCNELVTKKEISINPEVLTTRDDKGETKTIPYQACGEL